MSDELKTMLRDRLDDVNPDLWALHTAAVRQGTRIRRARRAGLALGAAAAVAAVGVVGSQLIGGTPQASEPGFATAPPAGPARVHVGDVIPLPGGGTATVTKQLASARHNRYQAVVHGKPRQVAAFKRTGDAWLRQQYPLDRLVVSADVPTAPVKAEAGPVDLPGWNCQWFPADEKGACTTSDGHPLSVNWRPAREHTDYLDPAKAGVHTFVSAVHGDLFVTIQPGADSTQADVEAAANALVWRH